VSDLPFPLSPGPASALLAAIDREGKLDRALESLGPLAGRDVVVLGAGPEQSARWSSAGARLTSLDGLTAPAATAGIGDSSADVVVSTWAAFRGVDPTELAEADRLLRPGGRLLVVHDYGRDDVSRLRGDLPEYGAWSRRDGPFLANGFRVRVIHCFWTFDTLADVSSFLGDTFGEEGAALATSLKRPRLSWNVAVYHRTRAGNDAGDATARAASKPAQPSRPSRPGGAP
jgi:hypothetical protein